MEPFRPQTFGLLRRLAFTERLRGAAVVCGKVLVAGAKTRAAPLLLVTGALALVLLWRNAGPYLEERLYVTPVMKLRAALGRQPSLDPRIRVIVAEDRSLTKLGRRPTFVDWRRIADQLRRRGYQKVFLTGLHNLPEEIGKETPSGAASSESAAPPLAGDFILGAVVSSQPENLRASALADVPLPMLTQANGVPSPRALNEAQIALVPSAAALRYGSRLGHLNVLDGGRMPLGYRVGESTVLPNIGLLVLDHLSWDAHGPRTSAGPLVSPADGNVFVDYIDRQSLADALIPVSVFFGKNYDEVTAEPSPKLAQRLRGGTSAILVPDAYTGSRFIDTPFGSLLSYVSSVAMVNSALKGRFLYASIAGWQIVLVWWAVLVAIYLGFKRRRTSLILGAVVTAAAVAGALGAFIWVDLVFPGAQIAVLGAVAWGVALIQHALSTMTERTAYRRDLELGRAVQRLVLPTSLVGHVGQWEYKVAYRPYGAMSGDWFQIFARQEAGATGVQGVLAIGDSVGKGASAALSTAVIAGAWNNQRKDWSAGAVDSVRFVEELDRTIETTFRGEQYTTLSLAVIMDDSVVLVCCGAPSWIHIKAPTTAGEKVTARPVKTAPCNPIGLPPMERGNFWPPKLVSVKLEPNDILVAYTDGVLDGMAARRRFIAALTAKGLDLEAPDALHKIERLAVQIGAPEVLPDDLTIMFVRRVPDSAAPALKRAG